jgi:hypothetical protein
MSINSVVNDLVTSVSVINALKPLPPTISGYSVAGKDDLALDPAGGQTVQINGTGFLPGATITFDGSAVAVVTYVNPNQLTFTSPAKTAGTYTIYAVNPDGGTAIYVPGIIYSTLPTWTTAAGSLGSYYETTSISNTVVAAGDAPVTYSLYSGSLPIGSTLSANGVITGTAPVDSSSTTYSFTIQASDAQLQDSTRSFSLTINVDAVTWVSPANNTTYTSAVDSAISTVTLSATDAAGYAVSYSANALPTGLSLTGSNIAGTPTVIADSSTLLTATAATTNRTAVRTINWSITVANDVYFEYNTLLIPGASTTFVDDASTNNFAVSIFGDTKPNNTNPYTPGYYSNYFDGSGDYLTVPANAIWSLAGDFTVEAWVYQTAAKSVTIAARWPYNGTESVIFRIESNQKMSMAYNVGGGGTNGPTSTGTVPLNTWNHVVWTRSGTTLRYFINGVLDTTSTLSGTFQNSGTELVIGTYNTQVDTYMNGYISNLRVSNSAVYTTAFTPSTQPLTSTANTLLLTCQSNRFIDTSTNSFTITVSGNTSVSSFDPFTPNSSYSTYGSAYFDGTGDYLSAPSNAAFAFGTGDFTFECWVYTSSATNQMIFDTVQPNQSGGGTNRFYVYISTTQTVISGPSTNTQTSSNTIKLGAWNHIVVVRSASTRTTYINGVSGGSAAYTTDLSSTYATIGFDAANSGTIIMNGYISNLRVVKGTAVYTSAFTPPTAPLTAIANTSLLTLQNNQSVNNNIFLDNSTNNFFVTRNGNTTQGTFSPYGPTWSNYFNGTSNLACSAGTGFTGTTFTIEGWVNISQYSPAYGGSSYAVVLTGSDNGTNGFEVWIGGSATSYVAIGFLARSSGTVTVNVSQSYTFSLNTWYHVAVVKNGTSYTFFVNGTSVGTSTSAGTWTDVSTLYVGYIPVTGYNEWMFGYISNLRISKGAALYSSNFTPSTTPLTAITNTSLLTCQSNRFVDNSINNFAITLTGSPTIQRFSPFNPSSVTPTSYSGYFDGTGDYLTVPANTAFDLGTGNFTIECWFYYASTPPAAAGYDYLWGLGSNGVNGLGLYIQGAVPKIWNGSSILSTSGTISATTWYHIAVVKNSSTLTVYLNGTSIGSVAFSSNLSGGGSSGFNIARWSNIPDPEEFPGYISNIRIVKGTAVYTSTFTPSTTPLTAISGTSLLTLQSPTFIDNSTNNFTISAFGNSQPTQQNPFGFTSATTNGYTVSTIGGSGYFDGTGDYLTLASNTATAFQSNNFTMEFYVYLTNGSANANQCFYSNYTTFTNAGSIYFGKHTNNNGFVTVWFSNYSISVPLLAESTLPPNNQWTHYALVRSGNTFSLYRNGALSTSSTAFTGAATTSSNANWIFTNGDGLSLTPAGYLTDFRTVNGTAVYTSNFVPPSAPLTAVQNTVLLNNMTSAGIYDAAMMNNMETVGGAQLSTAISKFGGSSMSFDGTGDYAVQQPNINFGYGTGDFTIEFWLYMSSVSTDQTIFSNLTSGTSVNPHIYYLNNTGIRYYTNGAERINGSSLNTSTWYHIAVCRASGSTKMFINGTQTGSTYTDSNNYGTSAPLGIGTYWSAGSPVTVSTLNGYIDDLRVTKGYARYTSNFTAPTIAFPVY